MTATKLSDTMIRTMLEALRHRDSDGRFEILGGNRRTVEALIARGKAEAVEVVGAWVKSTGQPVHKTTRVYLTEEAVTLLRNGFVIMMGNPQSETTAPHREAVRSDWRMAKIAAELILGDIEGAKAITTTPFGTAEPTTEHLDAEQTVSTLATMLQTPQRIDEYGTGPDGDEPATRIVAHSGAGFPREYEFFLTRPAVVEEPPELVEEAAPVEVEEGEYRMFVGILREDARDMGLYQAANVRESVRQNDEQGRGAERLADGTIRAGYSWFVKVPEAPVVEEAAPVAELDRTGRPHIAIAPKPGEDSYSHLSAGSALVRGLPLDMVARPVVEEAPAEVAESPEEEVTPAAHTVYVVALASPVRGSSMAGQEVRTDYVREAIRTAARVEVKAVRIGNEGIIRVGSLLFIPQGLASV